MKKLLFAIFAHPDDEAFGPSGTLRAEARAGNDVHLISLTMGEAGANPDQVADLAAVREQEWRSAGQLIGAKSMTSLGYHDSQLDNLALIEVSQRLQQIISQTLESETDDVNVEMMSLDTNGITGHIDHIVAGRASCLAFYRLKQTDKRVTKLRLATIPAEQQPAINTDWLFAEPGRPAAEIDQIIDNRVDQTAILDIMRCHHSQRHDCQQHIANHQATIGLDHFRVLS